MKSKSTITTTFRWLAVFPGAVAASWGAWILINFLNRLTMVFQGFDPDSFLGRAYIETVSGLAMGVAFVYAGAKTAPANCKKVAFILSGIALFLSGVTLFPAILKPDYWAIWSCLCVGFGAGAVAYSVSQGETNLNQ